MPSVSPTTVMTSSASRRLPVNSKLGKTKRRRYTEAQLKRNLEILGNIAPPPPFLPPSPPASRDPSPAASTSPKRKRDSVGSSFDDPAAKRARIASDETPSSSKRSSTVSSTPSPAAPTNAAAHVAPARVRKGKLNSQSNSMNSALYMHHGRRLKHKAAETLHGFRSDSHRAQKRSLTDEERRRHLTGVLQLTQSIISFAYSFLHEEHRNSTSPEQQWLSMRQLFQWCSTEWRRAERLTDKELAFLGLIHLIEASVLMRVYKFGHRSADQQLEAIIKHGHNSSMPSPASSSSTSQPTPPAVNGHAPSPAGASPAGLAPPQTSSFTLPPPLVQQTHDYLNLAKDAVSLSHYASQTFNLSILMRHYPATFARCTPSSDINPLKPHETYEIHDLEEETAKGGDFPLSLGSDYDQIMWLLVLGRSMIAEVEVPVVGGGTERYQPLPMMSFAEMEEDKEREKKEKEARRAKAKT